MVFNERRVNGGEAAAETRFYISGLRPQVKAFAEAVRGHWSIENNLKKCPVRIFLPLLDFRRFPKPLGPL